MTQVIGVIGLGTMGAGIVEVCLAAGHDVIAFDGFPAARETGLARVAKGFARRVEQRPRILEAGVGDRLRVVLARRGAPQGDSRHHTEPTPHIDVSSHHGHVVFPPLS